MTIGGTLIHGRTHVGRQVIVDGDDAMFGYELLHRSTTVNCAIFADPDLATREVVRATMNVWGVDELVGEHRAFVNVTTAYLQTMEYLELPSDRVVLELVETMDFGPTTTAAVLAACALGYTIALDDVVDSADLAAWEVLACVDFIKIDVLEVSAGRLASLVDELRTIAPTAKLIAEKIETAEMYDLCTSLGFDLFQGYHLARPEVLSHRRAYLSRR